MTNNLLDYNEGTDLAAFQWNVMANPAIFTATDKAKDGEINLKEGEYLGFTPDGRVIQKRPKEYAGIFDNDTSYFIYKFKDKNGSFYTWTGKNYTNDKGETFEVPDIPVTGKVAVWANSKNPDCYVWYKFIHVKNYTSKDFDKIKSQIKAIKPDEWAADYVSNHKPDCIEKATEEKSHGIVLSSINIGEDNKKNTIDCNGNQNQLDLLKPLLDKVNKVTSSYSASETNKILEENYSPCLFEHIGIEKRIVILNNLLSGDDSNWEFSNKFSFGDRFFLDHLVNSTPEKDRVRLLKDGFMANNYKWLEILWNNSTGFWNNDVTTSDIIPLIGDLSEWVKAYYNQLSIPITTKIIDGIGVPGYPSYEYPVASVNPICLGVPDDGSTAFYTTNVGNLPYALEIYKKPNISISNGKFHFAQHFLGRLQGQVVTQAGETVPQETFQEKNLSVSPFEPVVLIASRNYSELGIVSGKEYVVPAFVAAIYQQSLNDNASQQTLRSICNGIAITAAVLATPYTGGGSWAAYTTIAAGFVASIDEAIKNGRLQLGKSNEYDTKYASFYDAWNALYNTTLAIDALVNVPQVIRSIRSLDLITSTKNVYQNAKTSKLAAKFEGLWKSGKTSININEIQGQARKIAIAKYGKEAEQLIYVKFKEDGGAAAEIIAHFGQEGLDALKRVKNIEDVANELIKGKIAYRHIGSDVNYLENLKKTGIIPEQIGQGKTYFSLDKIDNPIEAIDKMQLNKKYNDAIWRLEFDTEQLLGKVKFPKAKWGSAEYIEVLTRSYPDFGSGGASQFITQSKIKLTRMTNLKTGEVITFK
ncbi:hypothetical protein [Prevotella histicola]|uniref:hypothetical protein n=1 Tax=Prevotella histicola TaxID=470565 RepID=UPI0028E78E8A|nr:hypothetical protein [Prevotella histicola]